MIVTLSDLKEKYSFTFSSDSESMFEAFLETAEEKVLSYADIESGDQVEFFEDGGKTFVLTHTPVREVCRVYAGDEPVSFRYEKRSHAVVLDEKTSDEVRIEYESGWEEAPATIKTAIALTVQHLSKLQNAKQMGILSRTTEGGTESIEQQIPPTAVKALLDRYKGVILG